MYYYATLNFFTMLGANHLAATVRQDSRREATEVVLRLAIDVPDDGESDPVEWLAGCLSYLLEDLNNRARHAL